MIKKMLLSLFIVTYSLYPETSHVKKLSQSKLEKFTATEKSEKNLIAENYDKIKQDNTEIISYLKKIQKQLPEDPDLIRLSLDQINSDIAEAKQLYKSTSKLNAYKHTKTKKVSNPLVPEMKKLIKQMEETAEKIEQIYEANKKD